MARITPYDIECTDFGADMGVITCFAWRDNINDKKTRAISIHETEEFKRCPWDDSGVLRVIAKVLLEADGIVAHYGDRFDFKYIKARLLRHKIILPDIPSVDTCLVARRHLRLQSNRLDNLAEFLGCKPKIYVPKSLWMRGKAFDPKALREIKKRCIGDVDTLAEIYLKIRPYCKKLGQVEYAEGAKNRRCHHCGHGSFMSHGQRISHGYAYTRLQCRKCGTWVKGDKRKVGK